MTSMNRIFTIPGTTILCLESADSKSWVRYHPVADQFFVVWETETGRKEDWRESLEDAVAKAESIGGIFDKSGIDSFKTVVEGVRR